MTPAQKTLSRMPEEIRLLMLIMLGILMSGAVLFALGTSVIFTALGLGLDDVSGFQDGFRTRLENARLP